jgi:hypothetical protein
MREDRLAGDFGEQFVESHATAAARRDDDGRQHDKELSS